MQRGSCQGWGRRDGGGVADKGFRVSFLGGEYVLELDRVVYHCEYINAIGIFTLK
jgi:hypothetical protein